MTNFKPHDPEHVAGSLLLTKARVSDLMGLSIPTLDRLRNRDPRFPKPVDCFSSKLFWRRADIERYVDGLSDAQSIPGSIPT